MGSVSVFQAFPFMRVFSDIEEFANNRFQRTLDGISTQIAGAVVEFRSIEDLSLSQSETRKLLQVSSGRFIDLPSWPCGLDSCHIVLFRHPCLEVPVAKSNTAWCRWFGGARFEATGESECAPIRGKTHATWPKRRNTSTRSIRTASLLAGITVRLLGDAASKLAGRKR